MVDSGSKANINVRSGSYWIAHATGECGRCRAGTRLVALALPPDHQSLELDWDAEEDESVAYNWESAEYSAFLFYVEYLPEEIGRRLQAVSEGYRFAFSERTLSSYWANHCAACGALIEDHDLFCEPDGAFMPTTAVSAAAVTLERVDQALQARAVGYACDPQFLGSMTRS
jgi:hypothetical protein